MFIDTRQQGVFPRLAAGVIDLVMGIDTLGPIVPQNAMAFVVRSVRALV